MVSGYECCKKIFINNKLSYDLLINTVDNFILIFIKMIIN